VTLTEHPSGRLVPAVLAAALAAALAFSALAAPVAATESGIAALRQATASFHSLAVARDAGYTVQVYDVNNITCITDPNGAGTMGIHFLNPATLGSVDPTRPQLVIYVPRRDGSLKLVAVEFLVIAADWDATHSSPPELFGEPYHLTAAPNRYGLPAFYELHVWAWQPNPSGMFHEWNPRVSC
jgi:hypothetical protein